MKLKTKKNISVTPYYLATHTQYLGPYFYKKFNAVEEESHKAPAVV